MKKVVLLWVAVLSLTSVTNIVSCGTKKVTKDYKPNLEALKKLITEAIKIEQGDKTTEAFEKLQNEIVQAKEVANNSTTNDIQAKAALDKLQQAINDFNNSKDYKPNLEALKKLITEAIKIEQGDKTSEAFEKLQNEIVQAKEVANNSATTNAQAKTALDKLQQAINDFNESIVSGTNLKDIIKVTTFGYMISNTKENIIKYAKKENPIAKNIDLKVKEINQWNKTAIIWTDDLNYYGEVQIIFEQKVNIGMAFDYGSYPSTRLYYAKPNDVSNIWTGGSPNKDNLIERINSDQNIVGLYQNFDITIFKTNVSGGINGQFYGSAEAEIRASNNNNYYVFFAKIVFNYSFRQ